MSTTFERALAHTMRFEGGFSADPDDPGGATNHGISLRFLRQRGDVEAFDADGDGDLTANDIRELSVRQAATVYRAAFWVEEFDRLPSQKLAAKLFDLRVNLGPRQATKLLQRALNACDRVGAGHTLVVDGTLGPKTLGRLGEVATENEDATLDELEDLAARFYVDLADRRPSSRKYLFGWLRRCYARLETPF